MATLAAASAEAEGLQVITEFRELHGKLIGTPREEILNVVLIVPKVTGRVTGEHVIQEFIVHRRCNVDMLAKEAFTHSRRSEKLCQTSANI